MAINGEASQPPLKFGVAAVDMMTGMYAAQAVLAALFRRERTGKGRHIEMALYDCGLMITGYYGLDALLLGHDPQRYGNAAPVHRALRHVRRGRWPAHHRCGQQRAVRQVLPPGGAAPRHRGRPRFATNVERAKNRLVLAPCSRS